MVASVNAFWMLRAASHSSHLLLQRKFLYVVKGRDDLIFLCLPSPANRANQLWLEETDAADRLTSERKESGR